MKKTRRYDEWRQRLDEVTPPGLRIGNDFLLIEDYHMPPSLSEPFSSDMTTCVVCRKGHVSISIDMVDYDLPAPCQLFMLPGQIIQCRDSGREEKNEMAAVVMSAAFSSELARYLGRAHTLLRNIGGHPLRPLDEQSMQVLDAFLVLLKSTLLCCDTPFLLETVKHLFLAFFYGHVCQKLLPASPQQPSTRQESILEQFLRLLRRHYRAERKVTFYADRLCLTPKYLSKAVRQASGKTVSAWIDQYVTTEAKALLRSTDMTVQQIALHLHFDTQALFCKYFKRVTGLSPREYRNKA